MNIILGLILMILGTITFIGLITIVGAILDGFVISILWNWFMVPIFDLPSLSIISALGLSLVIAWFTSHNNTGKNEEVDNKKAIILFIMRPILFLLIGYIVHLFM